MSLSPIWYFKEFQRNRKAALKRHVKAYVDWQHFKNTLPPALFESLATTIWQAYGQYLINYPKTDENSVPIQRDSHIVTEYIGQWEWALDQYKTRFL